MYLFYNKSIIFYINTNNFKYLFKNMVDKNTTSTNLITPSESNLKINGYLLTYFNQSLRNFLIMSSVSKRLI